MNYLVRKDIVLEKVSGVYVLVALRSAWDSCPFAVQTIPVYAEIWRWMSEGKTKEEIIKHLSDSRAYSCERAERIYETFIRSAMKYNYLIPAGETQ